MNPENQRIESAPEYSRDEFVEVLRNLAHRMSQPLTALNGTLEIALMGKMSEAEYCKTLEQSLEEAGRIAEILGMIREALDAEEIDEDSQQVGWKQIVAGALEEMGPLARQKDIQVVLDPMADVNVLGSPLRLATVTRDLMLRVIENCAANRMVQVTLSIAKTSAVLIIHEGSSSGAEAATEQQQTCPSFADRHESAGFYKWILRRAIERQGGALTIEKLPDGSAQYEISLPLAPPENTSHAKT